MLRTYGPTSQYINLKRLETNLLNPTPLLQKKDMSGVRRREPAMGVAISAVGTWEHKTPRVEQFLGAALFVANQEKRRGPTEGLNQ